MDKELELLAQKIAEKITKTVRKTAVSDFTKLGANVGVGASGTPTSYIDKLAEDAAISLIEKSKTPVNLLSEEAGFIDYGGSYTFVLDPVDGTRNAYRGIPFYAVSIAIGKAKLSDIEYGIVKNIPTGDVYTAAKHKGAFLNNKRISVADCPSKNMISSLQLGKNSDPVTQALSLKHNVRALGACSLEMCLVATSALDFYIVGKEYIRIIDLAASTLIVREAGGVVKTIEDEELEMDFSLEKRTSLVAACTEELVHRLLSQTQNI